MYKTILRFLILWSIILIVNKDHLYPFYSFLSLFILLPLSWCLLEEKHTLVLRALVGVMWEHTKRFKILSVYPSVIIWYTPWIRIQKFVLIIFCLHAFHKEYYPLIKNFYFVRAQHTKFLSGMLPVGIDPTGRILHNTNLSA